MSERLTDEQIATWLRYADHEQERGGSNIPTRPEVLAALLAEVQESRQREKAQERLCGSCYDCDCSDPKFGTPSE